MPDANPGANPGANNPFIGNPFMKGGMDGANAKKTARPAADADLGRRDRTVDPGTSSPPPAAIPPQGATARRRNTREVPQRPPQRPYAEPPAPDLASAPPSKSTATRSVNGKATRSTAKSTAKSKARTPDNATEPSQPQPVAKSSTSANSKASKRSTSKSTRKPRSTAPVSPAAVAPPAAAAPSGGYKVQVIAKIPVSNNTNLPGRDYLWFANYPVIPRVGDCLFQNGMYFRVDAVFLYENTQPGWCADVEVSYYARRR